MANEGYSLTNFNAKGEWPKRWTIAVVLGKIVRHYRGQRLRLNDIVCRTHCGARRGLWMSTHERSPEY
jgi:hypothetical protein